MAEENVDHVVDEQLDVDALVAAYTTQQALSKWLKIVVKDPKKESSTILKIQETHVVYMIETKIHDRSKIASIWVKTDQDIDEFPECLAIWRRYSEFDLLRNYLVISYPSVVVPPLPEKRTTSAWQAAVVDKTDPEFIERRRAGLQQFLARLAEICEVSQDPVLLNFLKEEEGWKESVYATNYQSKADSKLRALSASYRIKHPNDKFEAIKKYIGELEGHLGGILKTRARTAEFLYGMHKIHANYGRELSQWSSFEEGDMAEGLQKMGQYMDVFAQDIDICIENEEDQADQLKEYHGYCESVKSVCKKQELLLLELQQSEDALQAKKTERENLSQGKSGLFGGLKNKVFGGNTPEQKDEKLRVLDEQILEAEEKVRTLSAGLEKFEMTALNNIDLWQKQKYKEIHEIMLNFVIAAIDRCKKSRATWENIKSACEAM